jgi:predicted DNA-binding transcriptional regulator YafY
MLETSARLLRLLSLLQGRRDWPGAELADRLGVTTRTVRRDMDRLRELGYPVDATPGVAGGYRLGAGAALPPLLLDDEEAVAIAIGLRTAASGSVAGIEESSVRALAKLEQVLPSRLRHQVNTLQSVTVPLTAPAGPTVDPGLLTTIAAACRADEGVRFGYPGHEGTAVTRRVEPYRLVHTGRRWYLLAFDLDRDDWRTFRVDRIQLPLSPGPRFTPREPPAEDIGAYMSQAVSSAPYRYQARILMHAPIEVVAEQSSPTAGRLEAVDEHSCILHTGSQSLDALVLYVGLKGVDFEVLDPPELADQVRTLADRFGRAAPAPAPAGGTPGRRS